MSQILINSCEHHTDKCNKCISSINHIRDTLKSGNFFFAQHQEAVENTRSVYEEYLGLKAKISADKDDAIQFAQEKLELEEARLAYTQSCIEELSTCSTGGHQPHTSNHSERSGAVSRCGNVDTRNSRRQMEKRHPSGALTSESAPIKPDREVYYDHNYSDSYDCAPTETVASTHFHRNEQQLISSLQRRITEVTVTRTTFEVSELMACTGKCTLYYSRLYALILSYTSGST